jgi:cobalt-zinc-cadmium efflux system membrane fusion protein
MRHTRIMAALLVMMIGWIGMGCNRDAADSAEQVKSETQAFCEEHQIAEAQCPFCDASLIEKLGQCNEHGVPEALCYQCNPALIPAFKATGDWCGGHDRPESQCYICNPELAPAPKQKNGPAESSDASTSVEAHLDMTSTYDDLPRSQKPPSVHCSTQNLVVRFDTPEIARDAGLEFATVESRPITKTIECNAVAAYDGNRYAQLSSQVPGVVAAVHKDLGEQVERGEPLVTVTSAVLGAAKAAYLRAATAVHLWEQNNKRESDLLERGVSTERDVLEAEARLAESRIALSGARGELLSLGLSEKHIDEVARTGNTSAAYALTSSFSGVVVERNAVVGEVVDSSKTLCSIADISRMWALLDVYESEAREVRAGQPVVLRVDGLPGEAFGGEITWVSTQVDPHTRTLRARAELDNSDGALRANMFAQAIVSVHDRHETLVVPETAVQWEGCCNVVFVKKSDMLYEPRKVHLGSATGTVYEVLSGLSSGEEVVTQGSFLLKTEILKGSIGAGCCEVQPGS